MPSNISTLCKCSFETKIYRMKRSMLHTHVEIVRDYRHQVEPTARFEWNSRCVNVLRVAELQMILWNWAARKSFLKRRGILMGSKNGSEIENIYDSHFAFIRCWESQEKRKTYMHCPSAVWTHCTALWNGKLSQHMDKHWPSVIQFAEHCVCSANGQSQRHFYYILFALLSFLHSQSWWQREKSTVT